MHTYLIVYFSKGTFDPNAKSCITQECNKRNNFCNDLNKKCFCLTSFKTVPDPMKKAMKKTL